MTLFIQNNIVRFKVSKNNVSFMQGFESKNYFCNIKLRFFLGEISLNLKVLTQVSAGTIVTNEKELVLGLKGIAKPHNEGVMHNRHDVALS